MDKKMTISLIKADAGDDLQLLISHRQGIDNATIHGLAWKTFEKATAVAKDLKLYAASHRIF